jgi:hypothetical protein
VRGKENALWFRLFSGTEFVIGAVIAKLNFFA